MHGSIWERGHGSCGLTELRENLTKYWELDPRGAEIFAGDIVKAKMAETDADHITLATRFPSETLTVPKSTRMKLVHSIMLNSTEEKGILFGILFSKLKNGQVNLDN